jgi:hypothetical protein
MKVLNTFVGIILVFNNSISSVNSNFQTFRVISEVFEKLYNEKSSTFDVLFYGTQTSKLKGICDEFLKANNENSRKINFIDDLNLHLTLETSTVILISTQESFLNFLNNIELTNIFSRELKFLVYIEQNAKLKVPSDIENYFYETMNDGQFHQFAYFLNEFGNKNV